MNLDDVQLAEKLAELDKPFPVEDIEWRAQGKLTSTGSVLALAYITNRAVMERLDAVFGKENWRNEYLPGPIGGIMCGISVLINGEWITKWDGADATQVEPVKGGFSDAMKRAAVQWGIGRYLYQLGDTWAPGEEAGKGVRIKKGMEPKLPAWALPEGYKPRNLPGATTTIEQGPAEEPAKAQTTEAPKVYLATASTTTQAPKSNGKAKGFKGAPATPEQVLAKAKAYTIPEGLPGSGKTLGQLLDENAKLGTHTLKILAGRVEGLKVPAYQPKTDDDRKAVAAAGYILDQLVQAQPSAN